MNSSTSLLLPSSVTVVRWVARILSVGIVLFWGYFIVANLMGGEPPSRSLTTNDYIGLATMIVWLVGLVVAWKWELIGGAVSLGAILIGAVVNWKVLLFPGTLILVDALLFMLCWWIGRTGR